jgi:hypothetical protein
MRGERKDLWAAEEGMRRMGHACTFCHVGENPDQKIVFGGDIVLFLHNEKEQGA